MQLNEHQIQDLRQARQHLISCKKQLDGAKTHLEQFIRLVTPFKVNATSFSRAIQQLANFQTGLTQAQHSLEKMLPDRDKELRITISDEKPMKDPFWTPQRLWLLLAALAASIPSIWLLHWFMNFVTGK